MLRKKLRLDDVDNSSLQYGDDELSNSNNNTQLIVEPNTSRYFKQKKNITDEFLKLELSLNSKLKRLKFSDPVKFVYNPVEYAYNAHKLFVSKYCKNEKRVLFLGMNPGPFGMCQTGVPFGEVNTVRDWLGISCEVPKPLTECPNRPILGFNCKRSEISGKRFWNLFKSICETPENFFRFAYMHNYCPLSLMKDSGCNITPEDLRNSQAGCGKELEDICDKYLFGIIQLLNVDIVIGIGRYSEKRARKVLKNSNPLSTKVYYIPHPSPRVISKGNWGEKVENLLKEINVMQFFTTKNWLID